MIFEIDSLRIPLAARGLARLPDAQATRIVCEAGTVWITIDNDPRDIVLSSGQSFVVDRRAGVLMSALEDTSLRIVEPGAHAAAGAPVPRALHAAGAA